MRGEVAQRAVGLPQAAGDQLAARVRQLGAASCRVTVIEGEQARRRWQWQLSEAPVKIANYELLQRDREMVAELGLQFDLVVLDEAQRIKNRASATSQCARAIPRRRSWALTGTPVENSPQDLVGIFEFLAPGYLSDAMKPRRMGKAASDLRAAAHEGQGAHRPAAQDVPRGRSRAHARAARELPAGRGGGRAAADGNGASRPRSSTSSNWCCG